MLSDWRVKILKAKILMINLIIPVALIILLIPLTAIVIDILTVFGIICAILIFLITLQNRIKNFVSFLPTAIMVAAIISLTANLISVRLILLNGNNFNGKIILVISSLITSSGEIVNLFVISLLFLGTITFLTFFITKGAAHMSELAARFLLDSLPLKMMSIDAEYNSGLIN